MKLPNRAIRLHSGPNLLHEHVAAVVLVYLGNEPAKLRRYILRPPHFPQVAPSQSVIEVQLPGKQARHQDALCWEILVDRSDGDLGELRDVVHPEAENPMLRNQRIGRAQDVFAALATPRLLWNACIDANGRG